MRGAAVVALLLVSTPALAEERRYRSLDTRDMDDLAAVLRRHVAYVTIEAKATQSPLSPEARNAYAAVIEPRMLVALAHLVDDAAKIEVEGPKGRLPAKVVLVDKERRVALLETAQDLAKIGLVPALRSVQPRTVDMELFALVSTDASTAVITTAITDTGDIPEYEGYPRIDVKLVAGMPLFDDRARLVGYSRVLAWDNDRFMIVPFERVTEARTSTGAAARPAPPKTPEKPWWAR